MFFGRSEFDMIETVVSRVMCSCSDVRRGCFDQKDVLEENPENYQIVEIPCRV